MIILGDGPDARRVRLGFLQKKTKAALLKLARTWAPEIDEWIGVPGAWADLRYARACLHIGPARVTFSGRTELDCAIADRRNRAC